MEVGRLEVILHEHGLDLIRIGLSEESFLSHWSWLHDLSGRRHLLLSNREWELLRCLSVVVLSRSERVVLLLLDSMLLVIHLVRIVSSLLIIGPILVSPLTIVLSTSIITVLVIIGASSLVIGARVAISAIVVVGVAPLASTKALVTLHSVVT